jgi:hypothetical protein
MNSVVIVCLAKHILSSALGILALLGAVWCWRSAFELVVAAAAAAGAAAVLQMTQVDDEIKFGMIEAISHLIHRDYEAIVQVRRPALSACSLAPATPMIPLTSSS